MKNIVIVIVLFVQIIFVITCGPYVPRNAAVCCRRSPIQHYSCCCYDHKDTYITINYPAGDPPMNFIDTEGLDCNGCELGILC